MELLAIVGGDETGRLERINSRNSQIEVLFEDSILQLLGNPGVEWYSRYDGGKSEVIMLGSIYSWRDRGGEYHSTTDDSDAGVLHDIFEREGIEGLSRLNGEFFAVIRDFDMGAVHIATDRLGTIPAVTSQSSDATVVTTNIQLLASDPGMELAYDEEGLVEYFAFQRTYGTKTPLADVDRLKPGTVETYESSELHSRERYWEPQREPEPLSFDEYVDEFIERFSDIVAERSQGDQRFGLLLSGGSDSRLLAHYLPDDTIAYHMNDSMNREARVSKKIAEEAGLEFRLLKRESDYYYNVLLDDAKHDNYTSWFHEAHATGFEEEFADIDVLVSGLFADIVFGGYYIPKYAVRVPGPDWLVELPLSRDITSVNELIQYRLDRAAFNRELPSYLDLGTDVREAIEGNIDQTNGSVVDHDVEYPSVDEIKFSYVPLPNDFARDYFSMARIGPRWSPFLDMRMIDLQLKTPLKHMTKHKVVNQAVMKEAPHLGKIKHSSSGLGLHYPESIHLMAEQFRQLQVSIFGNSESEGIPYASNGSWPNHDALLQNVEVYKDYLRSEDIRKRLEELPFIDADEVEMNLSNSPSYSSIYPLMTLLETPIGQAVSEVQSD